MLTVTILCSETNEGSCEGGKSGVDHRGSQDLSDYVITERVSRLNNLHSYDAYNLAFFRTPVLPTMSAPPSPVESFRRAPQFDIHGAYRRILADEKVCFFVVFRNQISIH